MRSSEETRERWRRMLVNTQQLEITVEPLRLNIPIRIHGVKPAAPRAESTSDRLFHFRYYNIAGCCSFHCPPLLIGLAATAIEGVIQGASYDLVKTHIKNGIGGLRAMFPATAGAVPRSSSKTEFRLLWRSAAVRGQRQRSVSINFKREYKLQPANKRQQSHKSLSQTSRKSLKPKGH